MVEERTDMEGGLKRREPEARSTPCEAVVASQARTRGKITRDWGIGPLEDPGVLARGVVEKKPQLDHPPEIHRERHRELPARRVGAVEGFRGFMVTK